MTTLCPRILRIRRVAGTQNAAPSLVLLLLTIGHFAGCALPLTVNQQRERERYATLEYPASAEYGPDLDIVAQREGKRLILINRTARPYVDHRLWLNQQFVRDLPRIMIGPENVYDLRRWTNRYREPFPVGSLLAPDDAEPVVLAELINLETGLRHRLLVWPDDLTR